MTMRKLNVSLMTLVAGVGISACSTSQPEIICNVGRAAPFAVLYTLRPGSDLGGCGAMQEVHLNAAPQDLTDPTGATQNPDYVGLNLWGLEGYFDDKNPNVKLVAIRPGEFAGLDTTSQPAANAQGSWDNFTPDKDKQCTVPKFSAATGPGMNATSSSVTYSLTQFAALNEPSHSGNQFHATLVYSDGTCTGTYDVLGTYPAVKCNINPDCDPSPNSKSISFTPDPKNIQPFGTNLSSGSLTEFYGSGLPRDFPTSCINGYCMVKGNYPVLGAFKQ